MGMRLIGSLYTKCLSIYVETFHLFLLSAHFLLAASSVRLPALLPRESCPDLIPSGQFPRLSDHCVTTQFRRRCTRGIESNRMKIEKK